MKKTLVALAAIAATSAFADVSITGFIDKAYNRNAVTSAAGARTSSSNLAPNAIGQDQITFGISEDLGDGLTAYANIRVQPDITAGGTASPGSSILNDMSNVGLKGAFGNIQFASDYGTTWYTANMADASGWGVGAGNVHGPLVGGTNDAIIYTLPTMVQGLGVTVASVAGGDTTGKGAGNATAYMLSYGIGALNIQYAGARGKTSSTAGTSKWATSSNVGTNPAAGVTASATENIDVGSTSTQNALALTYDLGMAKLFFGTTSGKSGGDADQKASSSTYGVSIPFGAASIGIASSAASRTSAAAVEEKETGYRILGKYALSKRTTAYVQNGTSKVSGTTRATTSTGLGLTHSF